MLGHAGKHTFIWKTAMHNLQTGAVTAICMLKLCAGILIRQIEPDIVYLDKSI